MIEINRETGAVTWDNFRLHPYLTHDEFVERYPTLRLFSSSPTQFGFERNYQLPIIKLESYLFLPQVTCRNDSVLGVYFDMEGACYYPPDPECSMSQLLQRSELIRSILINYLGQPKRYNPDCFGGLDKNLLTPEEIDALQVWEYDFDWGGVRTCCFFEQGDIVTMGLGVGYPPSPKSK